MPQILERLLNHFCHFGKNLANKIPNVDLKKTAPNYLINRFPSSIFLPFVVAPIKIAALIKLMSNHKPPVMMKFQLYL